MDVLFWRDVVFGRKTATKDSISASQARSFGTDYPGKFADLKSASNLLTWGIAENEEITLSGFEHTLLPLKIAECNATENASFTDAYCKIEQYSDISVSFTSVFRTGCRILVDFLRENKLPEDQSQQTALRKLLTFFAKDLDTLVESNDVEFDNEAQVCLFLMNHLISELSACDWWKIDRSTKYRGVLECPCSTTDCPVKYAVERDFADLSIGNTEVWHGAVDAMTFSGVPCIVMDEGGAGDDDEQKFDENNFKGKRSQLFAEAIVYSFLFKKCNGSLSGVSFVPVLGIKQNAIEVAMYDAENDILLATVELKFKGTGAVQLSYATYLIVWLICNFNVFLCSLNPQDLTTLKKKDANFKTIVKEKLVIYQERLKFQKARRTNVKELKVPTRGEVLGMDPWYKIQN